MTSTVLGRSRGILIAAIIATSLAGCFDPPPRNPVPAPLVETARIPGYDAIRFWGDESTPAFDAAMTMQYQGIKDAAAAGRMPNALNAANFLAISGGGDTGSFAAGLLKGWTDRGTRPIFEAVTGVSTGALAAPFVFLGAAHDEDLRDIYINHRADQLYDSRGILGFFSNALNGTAPLRALIENHATDAFLDQIGAEYKNGRRLLVATTDIDAQRPMIWDLSAIAASKRPDRRTLFVNVLLATAAIPGVFPPVKISVVAEDGRTYDEMHVDGGVTAQMIFMPPEVRLSHFEERVFGKQRERTLYVIRNGKLGPEYDPARERALDLAMRGVSTLVKYQVLSNLRVLERAAQAGNTAFRFTSIPTGFMAQPHDSFDRTYAQELFELGREVGSKGEWSTKPSPTPELAQ